MSQPFVDAFANKLTHVFKLARRLLPELLELTRIERETIRRESMAEYLPAYISATPVAAAVAGLDKEAQAKITTDVRDALAAYRVGDGLAAPIETHVVIGHR